MINLEEINVNGLLNYLQNTREDEWLLDKVANKDLSKCCFFGHLFKYAAGKEMDEKKANNFWNYFEEIYATTYMVYPVNDGKNPNYPQETAKQRCIAYLEDLISGKAKKTIDYLSEENDWIS